jgi:biotin carboxylase
MKGKTIMIFGGGINQLELIKEANLMGITTVVIDPSGEALGKNIADHYLQLAGNDYQGTLDVANKFSVDGIVTGQMEKPLRLMAKLAAEKGYIFNTPKTILTSLNKESMKKAIQKAGIPTAKAFVFSSGEKVDYDLIDELNYPLIIKPIDAFSSRGVKKVENKERLSFYEQETRNFSSNNSILIEEFMEGREFSIESITYNGETNVIQVTEKFITPYPNTVEMGHLQPARVSKEERFKIEEIVNKAILAIGIDNTASHAEVMLTKNGPFMIEVGARLGGDFISSYLTKASTGVSMDKAVVQIALGIKPELIKSTNLVTYIKYIELPIGNVVTQILPINDLQNLDGFVFAHIFVKKGDVIKTITDSSMRPACILVKGENINTTIALANKYAKLIINSIIMKKIRNYA